MPLAAEVAEHTASQTGAIASSTAHAISDMRMFLSRLAPQSTAESLRLLRAAYPDVPLSLRVAACRRAGA